MKQRNWKVWGVAAAVVVLVGGGAAWWLAARQADDVQYRTGKIERGPLQATVSASGAVNPVTQVSVGTQVSGQIKRPVCGFQLRGQGRPADRADRPRNL
jgi:HlyD family secretion protein